MLDTYKISICFSHINSIDACSVDIRNHKKIDRRKLMIIYDDWSIRHTLLRVTRILILQIIRILML